MKNNGTVDKFIGDAIMAFWGAPLPNPDQAYQAAQAVKRMAARLGKLNQKWEAGGAPPFSIGIGVSMGDVVVGNLGSEQRFDYTIIGDEVNFSSRLEGLNKSYGTTCIIGKTAADALAKYPDMVVRELDLVMVKGKKEPTIIYELIGRK